MRSRPRGQSARVFGLGGEALTGVHAGQVLSPEIRITGLPTLCPYCGRQHWVGRYRECHSEPTGSETLSMRGSFMRENREISWSLVGCPSESCGQGQGRNPMMNDHEKSDGPVVPANHRNKAPQGVADGGEERGPAKGSLNQQNTRRTQSRVSVPSALARVRQSAELHRWRSSSTSEPEVGAQCGSSARWDLCGGSPGGDWSLGGSYRDVRRDQNRHEVVDESSIHERSSDPSWPRVMRSRPRGQTARPFGLGGEALTGVHAGQVLSPDIRNPGLPTPCPNAEGNIGWRVIASANWNPRGPRPCACVEASCARTGRSHRYLLDMAQRVAWARPRL